MDKFIVSGEVQLKGNVKVSGAKNAALPIMAASIICSGISVIHGIPNLSDIRNMIEILRQLGTKITQDGNTLIIDSTTVNEAVIPEHLMRLMRASIFLMGALTARFKEVQLSYPGGCAIGPRPIDLHIKALEKLGADVTEQHGLLSVTAKRLIGSEIVLDFPSVGATENAMMAAVMAEGVTLIRNAAREPEIVDLAGFLNEMGARVKGAGTDTIYIDGVEKLQPTEYTVMKDRIEAGTFLLAGAVTHGDVVVEDILPCYLNIFFDKLLAMGVDVIYGNDYVRIRANSYRGVDIKTLPFPGFPTDLQAATVSLLTLARGTSVVTETIFENRFQHVEQLNRMGAKILVEGRSAIIRGVTRLTGTCVDAWDLRAGAALIIAGLAAEGITTIQHIYHIDRGYDKIEEKLQGLGANIIRACE